MPNLDGTGPMGQGPATGRGMGNCASCGQYRNLPRCRGCGLGLRRFWINNKSNVEGLKSLESQLKEDLNSIQKEISDLESKSKK